MIFCLLILSCCQIKFATASLFSITESIKEEEMVDETYNEEVQLFDWELLQAQVMDYLTTKTQDCEETTGLCFEESNFTGLAK